MAGIRREVREEAGIELLSLVLRGTMSWPGFGKNGEDWLGFVFLSDAWSGVPSTTNDEGELEWVERSSGWSTVTFRFGRATAISFRWCSTTTPGVPWSDAL